MATSNYLKNLNSSIGKAANNAAIGQAQNIGTNLGNSVSNTLKGITGSVNSSVNSATSGLGNLNYSGSSSTSKTHSTSSTTGGSSSSTTSGSKTTGGSTSTTTYDNYKPYEESQSVLDAKQALSDWEAQKPGAYESAYREQIDSLLNDVLNRDKFSYDFNGDPLYNMFKDSYMQQGKQANIDTQAQAAALSGGYGNSYGATAGALAQQDYYTKLNNMIPEFYDMALDKYKAEGEDMQNKLGILQDQENSDYGRYRDTVSDWQNQRDYLAEMYGDEYARDFEAWAKEIALGGQTTNSSNWSNTDSWSNTESRNWSNTVSDSSTVSSSNSWSTPTSSSTRSSSSSSSSSASNKSGQASEYWASAYRADLDAGENKNSAKSTLVDGMIKANYTDEDIKETMKLLGIY